MVRKAPATTKNKGNNTRETNIAGITGAADMIQQLGNEEGIALDQAIARAARETSAADIMTVPVGGLNSEISARINSE